MEGYKVRFASLQDAGILAETHWQSTGHQPGSFMGRLGKRFLHEYWRLILHEKHSVILCAEDVDGQFLGFVSGTTDSEERQQTLRRNKLRLGVAALPALLKNPRLLRDILMRQRSQSALSGDGGFVVQTGAREDYWAWLPKAKGALELHLKWMSVMRLLGVDSVKGEVDKVNDVVLKTHRILGARVIKEFVTPDGKTRLIIEYKLQK